jgi:hypothetical protein
MEQESQSPRRLRVVQWATGTEGKDGIVTSADLPQIFPWLG